MNPPALRATTSNENVVLLIRKHLRVYFWGNRPERRSPIRRVGVRPQDRAGSETGAPIARFVPNRSAGVGTSAEPPQRRGLAERCELGQLALRRQGRFRGSMRETLGEISPRPFPPFRMERRSGEGQGGMFRAPSVDSAWGRLLMCRNEIEMFQ